MGYITKQLKKSESNRKYREKNKEELKQKKHEYYLKNRERISQIGRNWWKNNKSEGKKIREKYRKTNPWMTHFWTARQRCTKSYHPAYHRYGGRGILFKLTMDEVKFLWFKNKAFQMKKPTIDRINNDGNYELTNCCFLELIDNIRKYWKDKEVVVF